MTSHIVLRPPSPRFVEEIHQWIYDGVVPWHWRGRNESPAGFQDSLWSGVLVQFAVTQRSTGRDIGLVTASGASLFHGYAYVTARMHLAYRRKVWPLQSLFLFANYLFTRYGLRNLYSEVTPQEFRKVASGEGRYFDVEGRLRNHTIVNGVPQDVLVLHMSRERWLRSGLPVLRRSLPSVPTSSLTHG
jgi:RimJ/RimL family protein N-acetyltransferase